MDMVFEREDLNGKHAKSASAGIVCTWALKEFPISFYSFGPCNMYLLYKCLDPLGTVSGPSDGKSRQSGGISTFSWSQSAGSGAWP